MSVCVLGSINMDIVLSVDRLPRPGETVSNAALSRFPGGKGANQAIAAARLGASTAILGAVGADGFGTELLGYLAQSGVDTTGVIRLEDTATGQAYICVSGDGENSIVVVPGANHVLVPSVAAAPEGYRVFLSQLEIPAPAVRAFFSSSPARSGIRILNAAPAVIAAAPLVKLADFVIVNETELALFAGAGEIPASPADIEAMARGVAAGQGTVIVTLGANGAVAVSAEQTVSVPGRKVRAVDTTGAGDCFCGALAAALDAGQELRPALDFANAAAAIAVTRHGAAPSMPSHKEVTVALAAG